MCTLGSMLITIGVEIKMKRQPRHKVSGLYMSTDHTSIEGYHIAHIEKHQHIYIQKPIAAYVKINHDTSLCVYIHMRMSVHVKICAYYPCISTYISMSLCMHQGNTMEMIVNCST